MSSHTSPVINERRDRCRVVDAVGLEFRTLSEIPAAGEPVELEPSKSVRSHNKYDIDGYGEVKREYPEVAEYIVSLEERIRQLQINADVPSLSPSHKVSLSASGIAFADDRLLQPGDMINIKLTLFPAQIHINCDGTVVGIGDVSELAVGSEHTYRVTFTRILVDDKNLIEGHVRSLRKSLRQDDRL